LCEIVIKLCNYSYTYSYTYSYNSYVSNTLAPSEISLFYRVFFILHLDLTVGLIRVMAQQIQKSERASLLWRKVLPTKMCLVTSCWSIFQISRQPRRSPSSPLSYV